MAAALLNGCLDEVDVPADKSMEIVLKSYIPSASLSVKSEGVDYDSQVEGGLEMSIWRWDEGGYGDVSTMDPLSANLSGNPDPVDEWKRAIHFTPAQYYKDRTSEVGFFGCFPAVTDGKWVKTDSKLMTKDSEGHPVMQYDIDGQTDVMFSDYQQGTYDTGIGHLTFSHALCRYRVYAYAVDDEAQQQWGDLRHVKFLNLPDHLYVCLPKDFTDPSESVSYTYSPAPASSAEYTPIILEKEMALPVGVSNKAMVGTYLGGAPAIKVLGVTAETANYNAETISPISIARDFKPGYTYNIILRFSTHGVVNADVVTEEWTDGGRYEISDAITGVQYFEDLSRYGTANSYVVSSANVSYCFNAMVKGNGVNTVTRYDGEVFTLPDQDIALQTVGVEILSSDSKLIWDEARKDYFPPEDDHERHAPIIELLADHVIDGKILFDVIGRRDASGKPIKDDYTYRLVRKGNVRIGGYDAAGNLIWSWHIWVTDRPQNFNYGNGYVSMDRNLGAVSIDPRDYNAHVPVLSGCVYQWGRKDPLFVHEIEKEDDSGNKVYIKEAPVTVAEAHKYPRSFFALDESEYISGSHDWTTETNPHLWGWASERDNIVKTLYDPCPPGYRVNGNALWEFQSGDQMEPEQVFLDNDDNIVASGDNGIGYYFGIRNYAKIYYPATTFVHHDGEVVRNVDPHQDDNKSAYVYRYSATPYVSDKSAEQGLAYHFRFNIEDSEKGVPYMVKDWNAGGGRVQAFPVRCVYEDSRHEITDLSREQTANTYILDHARYFKFNAVTPGNAVGALNVQFNDGSLRNINFDAGVLKKLPVTKVDVLWWQGDLTTGSQYMNAVAEVDALDGDQKQARMNELCPIEILDEGRPDDDGKVLFRVPTDKFQNANIILAGYDENGVIQWTWHMWMIPGGVDVVRFGDYNVLDRNLGATYAPKQLTDITSSNVLSTHGFYYQWGRKDPFVGMQAYNQTNNADTSSPWFYKSYDGTWTKKTSVDKLGRKAIDIIETIKNPTRFADSGQSEWQDTYESNTENDGPINQMWGYTGVRGAWGDTFAKTMWDPCPPGYKVMNHIVFESGGLWNPNTGSVESYRLYYQPNNGGTQSSDFGLWLYGDGVSSNGGMYTSNSGSSNTRMLEIHSDGLWFPNTRRLSVNGVYSQYQSNKSGYVHSACPYSGSDSRTFRWYCNQNQYANTAHANDTYIATGTVIRCVKE